MGAPRKLRVPTPEPPMPEEGFHPSVTPYVNQTRDCYFHSLGELSRERIEVSVTDQQSGEMVPDESPATLEPT